MFLLQGKLESDHDSGTYAIPRRHWAVGVGNRRHRNIAAVALSNKNVRTAWTLLIWGGCYDSQV
ncbi:MAG: hypothetical protein FWD67_05370 [Betaproteobacteria bacterium]|nr:hypothetical protein [Betaproteobacteria bacterium]